MGEKKRLEDVFKTVGLPPYTYVKPAYYGEVRTDIRQPGKHLLIEGPSGIGKTCVAYKVFEELGWQKDRDYSYVSCRDASAVSVINAFFNTAATGGDPNPSVIVIDDLHLLTTDLRAEIGGNLKRLSDRAFETNAPPKAILIGIPTAGVSMLANALDLGPRLGSYQITRASDREIDRLISEGEDALNVLFEDREILLSESAGNFWLAQFICSKVCSSQGIYETQDEPPVLSFDLLGIRQRLMTELTQKYLPTARVFAKGKRWRPGGNKPYLEVLLAIAKIPDSVITFDKVLNVVPERRRPGIKAVRPRIAEVICDPTQNVDLRKQVAFDPDSGFSIEDPLFRYFLSNLDTAVLYRDLGIEADTLEEARIYTYDIGFSFAGEARAIVEAVNAELKAEDVVTFYDFDQQAVLLALDLEAALQRIYSESCRYYLVFLDAHYLEKVWTRFEKDIMTSANRRNHIVPVVLDDTGGHGAAGIPSGIGRIDLREQWSEIARTGRIARDAINAIRNRCVLPMIEKINDVHPTL